MSQTCRDLTPLHPGDLNALELMLDTLAATKDPRTTAEISILLAQKLVASVIAATETRDVLLHANKQARNQENVAWRILETDIREKLDRLPPQPGDFGTDPEADWPTDFPKDA